MFEQAFRNIDDVLRKEAGCGTELDYAEQSSWLLFLKYLDGLEQDRADEAALDGKKYSFILDKSYRWEAWAAPKDKDGKIDHNKVQSGDNLREIIDHIDELRFRSQTDKHELSQLYEEKIKRMGNAGRNGGEYYTPRPLIRAIVRVVKPKIGEKISDHAVGSAGFLCESFDYMKSKPGLTTKDLKTLQ